MKNFRGNRERQNNQFSLSNLLSKLLCVLENELRIITGKLGRPCIIFIRLFTMHN